jgi:hypothetical protein
LDLKWFARTTSRLLPGVSRWYSQQSRENTEPDASVSKMWVRSCTRSYPAPAMHPTSMPRVSLPSTTITWGYAVPPTAGSIAVENMSSPGRSSASTTVSTCAPSSLMTRAVFSVARTLTATVFSSTHPTQLARPLATRVTGPLIGRRSSDPRSLRNRTNVPSSASRTPRTSSSDRISASNPHVTVQLEQLGDPRVRAEDLLAGRGIRLLGVHRLRPGEEVLHIERRDPHAIHCGPVPDFQQSLELRP